MNTYPVQLTYSDRMNVCMALKAARRKSAKDAWTMRTDAVWREKYRREYHEAKELHIKVRDAFIDGTF